MPQPTFRYVVLAALFCYAGLNQVWEFRDVIHAWLHPADVPAEPLSIRVATRIVGSGPFSGDEILAIGGKPFNAYRDYVDAWRRARPGDKLRLTLSEPSGLTVEREVAIPDSRRSFEGAAALSLTVMLDLAMPVVALLLGFGVAAIRPRDRNAWLLLLMMLAFTELLRETRFRPLGEDFALVWHTVWVMSWPVWMLLFGVSFPERLKLDLRRPWLKYIVLTPAALTGAGVCAIVGIWNRDLNLGAGLHTLYNRLSPAQTIFSMIAISGFFSCLSAKRAAVPPDAKRRLRILLAGASASLTPIFLVSIYSLTRGQDILGGVAWPLVTAVVLLLALFPAAVAYAIVVERAMDLTFVVRQGVRYGIARGGLWVTRFGLILAAVWLFTAGARGSHQSFRLSLVGVGLLVLRKRMAERATAAIDRRFFREAYNAEHMLIELAGEVGRHVEIGPLLETVARRIGDTMHVPDIVMLLKGDAMLLKGDAAFTPRYSTRPGEPMNIALRGRIAEALLTRRAPLDVYFDKPPDWIRELNAEELQTLDHMRTQLLLPIFGKDGLTGIVSLGAKLSEQPYSTTDVRLLGGVMAQMSVAVENTRLVESLAAEAAERERANRELEIAREVQERLFPRNPVVNGCDCAGYCRPARGVGGDYYDFIRLGENQLGIAIGDVSGKGIAAALLMASLQASLRGQTMADVHDLSALMHNVNRLVYEASTANRYATFFYGELDLAMRVLRFVNAGHNAPIVLRGDEVLRLEAGGPVVGLLPMASYGQDAFQIQPGDIFVAYTDGISEAMNEAEEEWEEERFIAAARHFRNLESKAMIERIFAAADAFTGRAKQYDDMTLVVLKVRL